MGARRLRSGHYDAIDETDDRASFGAEIWQLRGKLAPGAIVLLVAVVLLARISSLLALLFFVAVVVLTLAGLGIGVCRDFG
jgi:hypothetical protein